MQFGNESTSSTSLTREMFRAGRTCGECLLLAAEQVDGPGKDVLLRAVKGLSAGRAGTCSLLVAGLLVIAEKDDPESHADIPYNDLLETFVPDGGPGSHMARGNHKLNEFKRRFEDRVRKDHKGMSCADITEADWGSGLPVTSPGPYPDETCVSLADATVSDLNEILSRT
ncbi:MAG: hypothetical protein HOC77_10665 [Chloroflexi bacterium]|jgi:hypothetical protein|nr:hypothetical protein [Chloroflexota bacterium]MBT4073924.1 hypothetical protein [Chloroflexota bacterium]MBT4515539.1 hypothetical protein [Chloroflexota bacterium]MBT6681269.1 hypothetical protein [Chloroflexota bacterium]